MPRKGQFKHGIMPDKQRRAMFAFLAARGDLVRTKAGGGALRRHGHAAGKKLNIGGLSIMKGHREEKFQGSAPKLRIPKSLIKRYGPRGGRRP